MSITFSQGGFLGKISSSDGNIYIDTHDNSKSIVIGGLVEYTGSERRVLDPTTKGIAQSNTFNLSDGMDTIQSASATDNQIQMQQTTLGAFITVSGSAPGFNIIRSGEQSHQRMRAQYSTIMKYDPSQGSGTWTWGVSDEGNFVIVNAEGTVTETPPHNKLIVSSSGDLVVRGKLIANEYHTTYNSSSIIFSSGSTIFGDTDDDLHSFTGSISSSGDITAGTGSFQHIKVNKNIDITGDVDIDGGMVVDGNLTFGDVSNATIKLGANNKIKLDNAAAVVLQGDISASGTYRTSATEHRFEGNISSSGATIHKVHQFPDGDTTPSVANKTIFKTANSTSTTITGLDDGVPGQIVHILIQDNNTDFTDGTNFNLFRSLNWTSAATNDVLSMICVDGTKWVTLQRSDNT